MKIRLNNDRLSHWLVGTLFAWGLTFLMLFFPIFHSWLKVPTANVATLTGLRFGFLDGADLFCLHRRALAAG